MGKRERENEREDDRPTTDQRPQKGGRGGHGNRTLGRGSRISATTPPPTPPPPSKLPTPSTSTSAVCAVRSPTVLKSCIGIGRFPSSPYGYRTRTAGVRNGAEILARGWGGRWGPSSSDEKGSVMNMRQHRDVRCPDRPGLHSQIVPG